MAPLWYPANVLCQIAFFFGDLKPYIINPLKSFFFTFFYGFVTVGLGVIKMIKTKPVFLLMPCLFVFLSVLIGCSRQQPGIAQRDTLFLISLNGKVGYIDKAGKLVVNPQFDVANNFSEGLAGVCVGGKDIFCEGGKWGYIDKAGKYVINPQFDGVYNFSEGLGVVKIGGKWGYIDKAGKLVVNPQFDVAYNFSEGLAGVKFSDKWGFIDKAGKYVINPQFDCAYNFSEGLAVVCVGGKGIFCEGGKRGFIDKAGKYVWNPTN